MGLPEKKQFLLQVVQNADERLTGLLIALAEEYNSSTVNYSSEEIASFSAIKENMLNESTKSYSPEEAHELIRNKKKNGL
jgi:hypothetical protein